MHNEDKNLVGHIIEIVEHDQCLDDFVNSSYRWLNEGIIVLLMNTIYDKKINSKLTEQMFVVQVLQESLRLDTYFIIEPLISEVNSSSEINFPSFHYIKVPAILRMLEQLLTHEVFRTGIKTYFNKQLATLDDFWLSMQTAYEAMLILYKFNIKDIMDAWIKQKHYPVIKVKREDLLHVIISIDNVNTLHGDNWWIPVTITSSSNPNFIISTPWQDCDHWLRKTSEFSSLIYCDLSKNITKDDWIIVNLQQIGYYRVNYDVENWRNIAKFLNSKNYREIHILNRAQIIDDAFHFLTTDKLNLSIFLELSSYLSQEEDYVAWYPMFKAFEFMSPFFLFQESEDIKENFRNILNKRLKKIGYDEDTENFLSNSFKQEAVKWACILDSIECKKEANFLLRWHLVADEISAHYDLSVEWKEWKYCKGLMIANYDTWKQVLNKYMLDKNLLKFLSCTKNVTIIINYMELTLIKNQIKNNILIDIFHSIIVRHANNSLILNYILTNFEKVKPREINTIVALIDIINHVYSEKHLDTITKFIEDFLNKLPDPNLKHININFIQEMLNYKVNFVNLKY
ncbi:hypothetical protein P5V15_013977 [Pogonomyrmex californicus]